MTVIRHRSYSRVTIYSLDFDFIGSEFKNGYTFDCDEKGVVDVRQLPPAAYATYLKCASGGLFEVVTQWGIDNKRNYFPAETTMVGVGEPTLKSREFTQRHSGLIECNECKTCFEFSDSWANQCTSCRAEYNGSGQQLASREQWGEETGETFSYDGESSADY